MVAHAAQEESTKTQQDRPAMVAWNCLEHNPRLTRAQRTARAVLKTEKRLPASGTLEPRQSASL